MKNHIKTVKSFVTTHKKSLIMAVGIIIIIVAVPLVAWAIRSRAPSYPAAKACDILTVSRAEKLLGDRVINTEANKPVVAGNIATSKCGYNDVSGDNMHVEALGVASAINDKGVKELNDGFKSEEAKSGNERVDHLGDVAYFNTRQGLLHILDDKKELVVSYGSGENMQANDPKLLIQIAKELLTKDNVVK